MDTITPDETTTAIGITILVIACILGFYLARLMERVEAWVFRRKIKRMPKVHNAFCCQEPWECTDCPYRKGGINS